MDDLLMADLRKLACQTPSTELWAAILERVGSAIYNLDASTDSKGYNAVADYVQHIVSSWPKEIPLRVPYTAYVYERYRLLPSPLRDKMNWEVPVFSSPAEHESIRGVTYRTISFFGMERTFMWLRNAGVWITVNYLDYYTFAKLLPDIFVKFEERSRLCTTWLGALIACAQISHALFQETLPFSISLEDKDLTAKQIIEKRTEELKQAEKDLQILIENNTVGFSADEKDTHGYQWPYPVFLPNIDMLFERHHHLSADSSAEHIHYGVPIWSRYNCWRWGDSSDFRSRNLRMADGVVFYPVLGEDIHAQTRRQTIHDTGLFCICIAPEGVNHYLRRGDKT